MLDQQALEQEFYDGGIARAVASMDKAEEAGAAHRNPYAKALYADYVLPLAGLLEAEQKGSGKAGRLKAAVSLLRGMDPKVVALLTVRGILGGLILTHHDRKGSSPAGNRTVRTVVGHAIYQELVMTQLHDAEPDLFHIVSQDLRKRRSKQDDHRYKVFRDQMLKAGIDIVAWPRGGSQQVGDLMLGLASQVGLVEIIPAPAAADGRGKITTPQGEVLLSEDALEKIQKIKGIVAVSSPAFGPCVEQPYDWSTWYDGGYHTKRLRLRSPLVRRPTGEPSRALLDAANALQRTRWAVNPDMRETIAEIARVRNVGDAMAAFTVPMPEKPHWLTEGAEVPPEREAEFKSWKGQVREWHTLRKQAVPRALSFGRTMKMAQQFEGNPMFFPHFADTRGRLYPRSGGLGPQGNDLQRGMLQFAVGKPLSTDGAVEWFLVQGPNKFGNDKVPRHERLAWVRENHEAIIASAQHPLDVRWWEEADSPFQFLAWCKEFERWGREGSSFLSYLPIGMDGSCSGLQHLSALFRDEVGGAAVNLVPTVLKQDVYGKVAAALVQRLQALPEDTPYRDHWLNQKIDRSLAKRPTMTLSYGVTLHSVRDYVRDWMIDRGDTEYLTPKAQMLAKVLWDTMGDVVVKGTAAMAWLKRCARQLAREGVERIEWSSPSGFHAFQEYWKADTTRINSFVNGPVKIRLRYDTDTPDPLAHAAGLAPNFVHSMDAAHLHLTTAAAAYKGVDHFSMIHDDFGTHAHDAPILARTLREEFVRMYEEHDPVADLLAKYPQLPAPPAKGNLDIRGVLNSQYFFD